MNDPMDAKSLYRQYREMTAEDRATAPDAIEVFKANRTDPQIQTGQFDRIMASVHAEGMHNRPSLWSRWNDLFRGQVLQLAIVCLCVIGLTGYLMQQRSYSWASLVPASVIEDGVAHSIYRSLGGSSQLGFTSSSSEESSLYSLGVLSTQLAVTMALKEESLLPYFSTSMDRLSQTMTSPPVALEIENLRRLVSERASDRSVGNAITTVQQIITQSGKASIEWYSLGQTMESLRLALVIADDQDDLSALKDMSLRVAVTKIDRLQSTGLPELNRVLVEIYDLSQGDFSLDSRRRLMQYIDQLNVLLK